MAVLQPQPLELFSDHFRPSSRPQGSVACRIGPGSGAPELRRQKHQHDQDFQPPHQHTDGQKPFRGIGQTGKITCRTDDIAETRPDYLLILPWNLRREIVRQMAPVIAPWDGRLVVPIPTLEVIEAREVAA